MYAIYKRKTSDRILIKTFKKFFFGESFTVFCLDLQGRNRILSPAVLESGGELFLEENLLSWWWQERIPRLNQSAADNSLDPLMISKTFHLLTKCLLLLTRALTNVNEIEFLAGNALIFFSAEIRDSSDSYNAKYNFGDGNGGINRNHTHSMIQSKQPRRPDLNLKHIQYNLKIVFVGN